MAKPTKKNAKMSSKRTASKSKNKKSSFATLFTRSRVILFSLAVAAVGSYLLFGSQAAVPPGLERIGKPFVEVPEKGLTWAGLRAPQANSVCGQLLEVVDEHAQVKGCTHGPDPAPEGVDVKQPVELMSTGDTTGAYAITGTVGCDGDGVSGNRIEVIYAHPPDRPNRYDTFVLSAQQWMVAVDNVFKDSAAETGGYRALRWVTDANCNVAIRNVSLKANTADDSFSNTLSDLQQQGYNRSDRKYLVMMDAGIYCGVASMKVDDQARSSNANNIGPSYARVDAGCWGQEGGSVEAHEIMHNLGGVQYTAPHTSGNGHCTDESDRMCYVDAAGVTMTYVCFAMHDRLFDCNHDDYFNTNPVTGNYLASHWNTANSAFLLGAEPGGTGNSTDTTAPTVSITSPQEGAVVARKQTISASSNDATGVTKMEIYIDGYLKASATKSTISTSWNTVKASKGTHVIIVKAYDAAGNVGQASLSVTR